MLFEVLGGFNWIGLTPKVYAFAHSSMHFFLVTLYLDVLLYLF